MRPIALVRSFALFSFAISAVLSASSADVESAWLQKLTAWRAQQEQELTRPDSWFSLVALDWLKTGANSIGSAPDNSIRLKSGAPAHLCVITVSGDTTHAIVQLKAPSGGFSPDFTFAGQPAREAALNFANMSSKVMVWQDLTMHVIARGDRFALRIADAHAPSRTGFHGLHWYAPNPAYRITARWTPYQPIRQEKISTVIGTTLDMPAPGLAEFHLNHKLYRLEPVLEPGDAKSLFFMLRDETSHTTTYGAGRFLYTELPDHGLSHPGSLILDFNRLENPPCAYTSYATCPLPPKQNLLRASIEAGEERYHS
jgi:uncharacterized protein (DUF1684 family)